MWKKNLAMARKVPEKDLDLDRFEYPKELIPEQEIFEFTDFDPEWVKFFASIASETSLDFVEPRTPEQRWLDNAYGLLGELVIKDHLKDMQVIFYYVERHPEHFKKLEIEPFDFAIALKNGEYLTLEIKTTKEPANHKHMIIREGQWKKSDYAIGVKMLDTTEDPEAKTFGHAFIAGYSTKSEILKLRVRDGEYPCGKHPCRAKKLTELHPFPELREIIDSEAIHWKGERITQS